MKKTLPDDSYTLHTDLYQLNMIETYWRKGIDQKKAIVTVFDPIGLEWWFVLK